MNATANIHLIGGHPSTLPLLAKGIATEACDGARKSAAEYVRAMYIAQVDHCTATVDTAKCADQLSADLTAYGKEIIQSALREGDQHIWDGCILRLRNAYAAELTDLSFDFAAKLRKEAFEKETKANAVTTARATAETSNAAKPIEELLKDGMLPYGKRLEELEKKFQSDPQAATASSSKPSAKPSKANATAKKKHTSKPKLKKARSEGPNAKRVDVDGNDKSKAVKKGKGKAKEPQDSDSD
ncbi:hypothetical protein C8R44DRAFT_992331 [Mycena epipterygia]|nr:hypothetical protein C8R44DRAFT_992331 [Mycena epipterygia]